MTNSELGKLYQAYWIRLITWREFYAQQQRIVAARIVREKGHA